MRRMSRRWKAQEELDETDVPYGPSAFAVEPEEVKV
jgi:hypothetical protein